SRVSSPVFFTDTATAEIYTLSLHDALPISTAHQARPARGACRADCPQCGVVDGLYGGPSARRSSIPPAQRIGRLQPRGVGYRGRDRKSTRLNSSHVKISYAVFCLKKKNKNK